LILSVGSSWVLSVYSVLTKTVEPPSYNCIGIFHNFIFLINRNQGE
jgi:hypothetical protein